MFVSGFTIVRNAVKYDYPVKESILSMLPLCSEVIVLIGNSEDETEALIRSIDSDKIRIHHSEWDDSLREGGRVLATETDKAFRHTSPAADWCLYLQADEVIHEQYYDAIRAAMKNNLSDKSVEGLLFGYKHFFGSYDYLAGSRNFYRNEVRIIRNDRSIHSYRDAQGFRKNMHKLQVKYCTAFVYHYGWVRQPQVMQDKIMNFHKYWHDDEWIKTQEQQHFDYNMIDVVEKFKGTHPACMHNRILKKNWAFVPDESAGRNKSLKEKLLFWIERKTNIRLGEYKNYKLI